MSVLFSLLRSRLLRPVFIALGLAMLVQVGLAVWLTRATVDGLVNDLTQRLGGESQRLAAELGSAEKEMSAGLAALSSNTRERLSGGLTGQLKDEQAQLRKVLEENLKQSGNSMAQLLAGVAPKSIWDNDAPALTALTRIVQRDPAVLFAVFYDAQGQRLRPEQNRLEVWADHRNREVRFGADKGLAIEPANRGLGRFLLAQGIAWARQRWGSYTVEGGALAVKDVLSEDARLRRDHFLRIQGFEVAYQDLAQVKAGYSASRVSVLNPEWNREKVQMIDLLDCGAMLQQADQNLHEQQVKIGKLEHRVEALKREDSGLRFTIACLVALTLFQAGLLIWIATR